MKEEVEEEDSPTRCEVFRLAVVKLACHGRARAPADGSVRVYECMWVDDRVQVGVQGCKGSGGWVRACVHGRVHGFDVGCQGIET